jgi:4'-phosphopantetheinyl transferase
LPLRCDVVVVSVPLDPSAATVADLERLLAADERARAARLVPMVRQRFIVGRGQLRRLLGRVVDDRPEALAFTFGPRGKPSLGGSHAGRCQFNVSHSGDLALVALAADFPLGIDLEHVAAGQTPAWADMMADTVLATDERAAFRLLAEPLRPPALLEAWVAKEAVLKASGEGIAAGMRRLVLPTPLPRTFLATDAAPREASLTAVTGGPPGGWATCLLETDAGGFAALACPVASCSVALVSLARFGLGN